MLYYLFNYLDQLDFPGAGMFKYVSFRSGLGLDLVLVYLYGDRPAYHR